jgi:hypothetical protein
MIFLKPVFISSKRLLKEKTNTLRVILGILGQNFNFLFV